ncbi:MAG: hypothetical protein ABSH48_21775, partial [Verrucomicrobiota bacterium]
MKTGIKTLAALAAAIFTVTGVASAVSVTYDVDLSVQTALGNFDPATDTVLVSGTFCDWTTTNVMTATADPNVYSLTFNDTADATGAYENHKFIIDSAGTLNWESIANRYFPVPAGATNLPVVFFNDLSNLPTSTISLTFQLDLQVAIQQGLFDPGSDYVDAFGSFNNWAETGILLTNVPGTSNYIGTFSTTSLVTNTVVNYKYAIDGYGGTWEGNVGAGGTANRSVTITNVNQTFPLDYWNNVTNANLSFTVGFEVNLGVEDAFGVFTPGSDTVFVNGDWNWSGSAMQLMPVGSSELYTGAVTLAYSQGTTINYKYTIDGGLIWENNGVGPGGAQNHQFILNRTNLPMDYFNNYSNLGPLTISGPPGQIALYWAAGTNVNNLIWLQTATNLLGTWSDVPNSQG